MTREEAIAYFKDMNECTYGDAEPVQMAIKALEQQEPTTKNNRGVDCSLDDFIKYCKRTFGVELTVKKSDNPDTYAKMFGTTKNNLDVDWESYKDVDGNSLDDLILEVLQNNFDCGNTYGYKVADEIIGLLPSVTPQEPTLDKIRAEIKALSPEPTAYDVVDGNPVKDAVWETIADVLQIIDKYKAESEDEE